MFKNNQCPIVEPVINRYVVNDYCHQINHICPIHTHVINKQIYNHTYTPEYTCSQETQIINNDPGCCNKYAKF